MNKTKGSIQNVSVFGYLRTVSFIYAILPDYVGTGTLENSILIYRYISHLNN